MKKYQQLTMFGLCLFISMNLAAQNKKFNKAIENLISASLQSDSTEMLKQLEVMADFTNKKETELLASYYLAFGKWQFVLPQSNISPTNEEAKKLIRSAVADLKKCLDIKEDFADAYAMYLNCLYLQNYLEPSRRGEFFQKIPELDKKARSYGEDNPRVMMTVAQNSFFTPEQFGGSQSRAVTEYRKAIELFEKETVELPQPNWGHSIAYGWLANAFRYQKDPNLLKARELFKKSLELRPDFSWVKNNALPAVEKQIADILDAK